MQGALSRIQRLKHEVSKSISSTFKPLEVPPEQRHEYNQLVEQAYKIACDIDGKLPPLCLLVTNEDFIKKAVYMIEVVSYQRNAITSGNPAVLDYNRLKTMAIELRNMQQFFLRQINNHNNQMTQRQTVHGMVQRTHGQNQDEQTRHLQSLMQQQAVINNHLGLGHHIQPPSSNIPPPPTQGTSLRLQPPPQRRNPKPANSGTPGAFSSPSPAAASTPTHNAATPGAVTSSPQLGKSPKPKAQPKKPRQSQRRQSKQAATPPATGAAGSTPTTVALAESIATTPSMSNASIKRQREDDGFNTSGASPGMGGDGDAVANGPSPPKRAKMENSPSSSFSGPPQSDTKPPEAARKVPEMAAEVAVKGETEEESAGFLDSMTQLIKLAASNEGQDVNADISGTLELLLKGYSPNAEGLEPGGSGLAGYQPGSPSAADSLAFDEIFDFSNMPDEPPEDMKDTPEFMRSSPTNPSPESNASESDAAGHFHSRMPTSSMKMEPFKTEDIPDMLPAGLWKEIDGGEAAYFQGNEWKWEGHMSALEQPWAIFQQD